MDITLTSLSILRRSWHVGHQHLSVLPLICAFAVSYGLAIVPATSLSSESDPTFDAAMQALTRAATIAQEQLIPQALLPGTLLKAGCDTGVGGMADVKIKYFQIRPQSPDPTHQKLDWWVSVEATTRRVLEIKFLPPSKNQETPFVPAWTEKRAIEVASCYRRALLEQTGLRFGESPSVTYYQQKNLLRGKLVYRFAIWSVSWSRITSDGHPFVDDTIDIDVSEKFGLVVYKNECHTRYKESSATRVVLEAAQVEGRAVQYAHDIAERSPAFKDFYGEFLINYAPADKGLAVVRPNDLLTCKDFHVSKESLDGALVWRFSFRMTHPSGQMAPAWLIVYVDAYTGELRGGSA